MRAKLVAFGLGLLLLLACSAPSFAAGCAGTGNCYWIGGSGNTSDTTKWATTDGGATTGSVPTSADNCNFTALSNTTAYTVTVGATTSCMDMTWALPSVSGVPTLTPSQGLNINGSFTGVSGLVWAAGTTTNFVSSSSANLTPNGVNFGNNINVSKTGGTLTLQSAYSAVSTSSLTINNGTFNTNAQTVSTGSFVSTSGTRTLTLDNSTINITGTSGTLWNVTTGGTLTFTATGSTINFNGSGAASRTFAGAGLTYGNFWWLNTASTGTLIITGANQFRNFTVDGTTARTVQFPASTVNIIGNFLQTNAGTAGNKVTINSSSGGTKATLRSAGPLQSLDYVAIQDILATGGAGWFAGTHSTNTSGNAGIQFTAPGIVPMLMRQHRSSNDNWPLTRMAA